MGHLRHYARAHHDDPLAVPFLGVELPHLTTAHRWLWIKFFNRDDGLSLECDWGDDTHLDDWALKDGDHPATSPDTTATPEQLAERAFSWVASQAAVPLSARTGTE
jgi:hypothetical protein